MGGAAGGKRRVGRHRRRGAPGPAAWCAGILPFALVVVPAPLRCRALATEAGAAAGAAGRGNSYYEELGIEPTATSTQIVAAFEALVQRVSGDAAAAAKEAFDVLGSSVKRKGYDALEAEVQKGLWSAGEGQQRPATAPASRTSLARGRPTWQSSTRPGGGAPELAVDGVTDSRWAAGSCTHTHPDGEISPWWTVDIGFPKAIGSIRLLNRLEAFDRLRHWRVFAGTSAAGPNTDPASWRGAKLCGEGAGPAQPGGWLEVDCGGAVAQHVGVSLGRRGGLAGEILTLCEVEVLEHMRPLAPRARRGAAAARALVAGARRYVEEFHKAALGSSTDRRRLYLRRTADLLAGALDALGDDDAAGLVRLYEEASNLPGSVASPPRSAASIASASPPVLLVRARVLERLALSQACRKDPSNCCPQTTLGSSAGCLATALALAKLAGQEGSSLARSLFELAVEGRPAEGAAGAARQPFVFWPSFRETCQLYFPEISLGSARLGPFWDPQDPLLGALPSHLASPAVAAALRADLEVLAQRFAGLPGFEPAYAALVEDGAWDRVVLYDGVRGWSTQWCGKEARPRLQLCSLLALQLPGESANLQGHYATDNHEEVSISRLAGPRTVLRPHSGGTNVRLNLDVVLPTARGGTTALRIGGQVRRLGGGASGSTPPAAEHLIYDACQDREIVHEGDAPLYFLEVGIMHPAFAADAAARRARAEL